MVRGSRTFHYSPCKLTNLRHNSQWMRCGKHLTARAMLSLQFKTGAEFNYRFYGLAAMHRRARIGHAICDASRLLNYNRENLPTKGGST